MRIARDRAWSKDIISAAIDGELEWQISSTRSIPLHNVPEPPTSPSQLTLPRKFTDQSLG